MEAKHPLRLKIIFPLSLSLAALTGSGQNLKIPRNEFALSFSRNQMELARGETGKFEILIRKSKAYRKSKAKMGVSSGIPNGVVITFDPSNGNFESSTASISVKPDATPGQYLVILNATLQNKTKGSILKLLIH